MAAADKLRRVEWPTLGLLVLCYGVWMIGTTWLAEFWQPLGFLATMLALTQHSSLQHEALHGHPFRHSELNEALVSLPVGLFIPYRRFRDTHLAHHIDCNLTDPYDDPESNYLDPKVWPRLSGWQKTVLRLNNTLLGRMVLGPLISQVYFMSSDWRSVQSGDRRVLTAWVLHLVGLVPVVWWLTRISHLPLWAYVLAAYGALSVLKIRTFLEHQAHPDITGRTVIIEDHGPLAVLFLNNNLHLVHHMKPKAPWYKLPALYAAQKESFLQMNRHYVYLSYGQIFHRYFLAAKDPVPHPLREE